MDFSGTARAHSGAVLWRGALPRTVAWMVLALASLMAPGVVRCAGLTLVSVPRPQVVTGGDVLLAAPVADLQFSLVDGTELTAQRYVNPEGGNWYLVEGLPESSATLVARSAGRVYDSLVLHNTSSDGPVISGPREAPFYCQTQEFDIGPGLGALPPAQLPACATRTRTDTLVLRQDGGFESVDKDHGTGATFVHLETGVIDRSIYQIAVPSDAVGQAIAPGTAPRAWNGKLIYKFGGGCRGGWYRQGASTAGVLDADLLGAGYAVASASLNVFGNNCNDLLASEVMMMVREHFIESYGPPRYTLGFGCSGGSYQGLQIADNYPGLLDGVLVGCTFPEVALATLTNLFDARLLENYFASAAADTAAAAALAAAAPATLAGTASAAPAKASRQATRQDSAPAAQADEVVAAPPSPRLWSTAQILAVTGYASINSLQQSAEGAARVDATPRAERKAAEFDKVVPEAARYRPVGHREGQREGQQEGQREGARPTVFDHTVNVYGRDAATGAARWALDNRGVQYGFSALNKGLITLAQFIDLNRRVGGMDRDGNLTAARTSHDPAATSTAYSSGRILSARGGLGTVPIVDYRAWADLQPKGDIHMAYHSQSLRARLRRANDSLDNAALLTEDGSCDGCELFSLKSAVLQLALQGMDAWLLALRAPGPAGEPPMARLGRTRPATLGDACWINGRKVDATRDGVGPCAERFPVYGFPRLVAGAPIANDIVACQLRPVAIADYPDATPAQFAALQEVFATGVCDWSRPGIGQAAYAGTWQSFGPVAVAGEVVTPAAAWLGRAQDIPAAVAQPAAPAPAAALGVLPGAPASPTAAAPAAGELPAAAGPPAASPAAPPAVAPAVAPVPAAGAQNAP